MEEAEVGVGATVSPPFALPELEQMWNESMLPYNWNPTIVQLRNRPEAVRLSRVGLFTLLALPARTSDEEVWFIHGTGSEADLARCLGTARVLRTDRATAEYLRRSLSSPPTSVRTPALDDYIYDVDRQVALEGKAFARRRTYLRALERSARSVVYERLDLDDPSVLGSVRSIYEEWSSGRPATASLEDEGETLAAALQSHATVGLLAAGLRVDDELSGFALFDIHADLATAHILKARRDSAVVAGTWNALFLAAQQGAARYVNGGYDGGLPGLRQAKESLRPAFMLCNESIMDGSAAASSRAARPS